MTPHTTPPPPLRVRHPDAAEPPDPSPAGPPPASGSRLLAVEDVSALLGVSPALVYALVRRGELPAVRIGERYVRFRAQALHDWIAQHETTRPRGTR